MRALKAQWHVSAEVIPGTPVEEFTKVWYYTSGDYEKDCETPETEETIFTKYAREASAYALSLQDPRAVNVVKHVFCWV